MGHMEEVLKYYNEAVRFFKELHEANPSDVSLREGLGISYDKLTMIYKVMANNEKGK
jgi:hypothetical protein